MNALANSLELSSRAAAWVGPKILQPRRLEGIHDALGERRLRAHHRERDRFLARELDQLRYRRERHVGEPFLARGARIARRDEYLRDARRGGELPRERVFAAAGADDQEFHERVEEAQCSAARHACLTVPKCRSVNTIAMPCSSAAAITSSSRTLPPGWMIACAPAAATTSTPSRNGKNASEATTEPSSESPALAALMDGDARRVDAAHLARAHAQRPAAAAEYDRVRLDEFRHAPCEQEIGDLGLARPRPGDDLELVSPPTAAASGVWTSSPPPTRLKSHAAAAACAVESSRGTLSTRILALPASSLGRRGVDGAARSRPRRTAAMMRLAAAVSSSRLKAMMPPKAEVGSVAYAFR